jgi:hypothetical protein
MILGVGGGCWEEGWKRFAGSLIPRMQGKGDERRRKSDHGQLFPKAQSPCTHRPITGPGGTLTLLDSGPVLGWSGKKKTSVSVQLTVSTVRCLTSLVLRGMFGILEYSEGRRCTVSRAKCPTAEASGRQLLKLVDPSIPPSIHAPGHDGTVL